MTLLSVRDLSVEFGSPLAPVRAVRGVSFDVAAGERVGLVGESGSGKTTTALALMRMIKPPGRISGGRAVLAGTDLLALDARQVREARLARMSYVPQGAMNSLNPVLRVREQILDGLADHGVLPAGGPRAFVERALAGVGLAAGVADMFPHELSGGMKQRACIAIAIALDPQLIIADEPTSALDVISQRHVMRTFADVQGRLGCGLVIIGHDMGLMAQVTDRIVVMRDGRIVEDAPVAQLFRAPAHAYSRLLIESVPSLGGRLEARPANDVPAPPAAAAPPLLALDRVGKTYGGSFGRPGRTALEPCDLAIDAGRPSIVAVVGQSGSGKTTMARLILGLETASTGAVRYLGQPIEGLRGRRRLAFRREVQAIFQDPYASFNPFYRVDRTLAEPMRRLGAVPDGGERPALERACTTVGLDPGRVLGRFPHELSGGQRQRLMVARALLLQPRLIVADEPVSMVDASLRMSILQSLAALRTEHGISIVYITHDLATAYHVSDHVLVLHAGRIVESGDPRDVILNPRHPYTRALVAAIPWPDPARPWPEIGPAAGRDWDAPPVIRERAAATA